MKKKIIISIFSIIFIINTILIFTGLINSLDNIVSSSIISIRNDNLTKIMINFTNIGGAYSLVVISILLLCLIKNKKIPIVIIINLISVFLTSQLLKVIFHRSRPEEIFLTHASGFSYPSGHTMVSLAYFGYLIYLINKYIINKFVKYILISFISLLILAIFISRIYLGVHYLSDIIGGICLGIIYLILFIDITNKKKVII